MADFILIDGDQATFLPAFTPAIVVVQPGVLTGGGAATFNGKPVCVEGDEGSVEVPGCTYIAGSFVIPGVGTLKIQALGGDQVASKTRSGQKKVLLLGSTFTAVFEVQSPAMMPVPLAPPVPDPVPSYTGSGMFVTTNTKFQGS